MFTSLCGEKLQKVILKQPVGVYFSHLKAKGFTPEAL